MSGHHIDNVLNQWENERPELDSDSLGLALLVSDAHRQLRRQTGRALRQLGLTTWEYDVLATLRRQGEPFALGATDLARESRLSSGAMTNRIDRLEARELVCREINPDDRRGILVYLTGAGLDLTDKAIAARVQAADRGLAALDTRQRARLERLLRLLADAPAKSRGAER